MVRYALRVVAAGGGEPGRGHGRHLRAAFPDQGWRIRDARHAAPGVSRFVEQTGLFLSLVGLTSLLVGGIGVATGVRAWLEARGRSIATLRCLGASGALVFWVCLLQILALTALGVVVGLVVGAALPSLLAWVFAGRAAGAAAARPVSGPAGRGGGIRPAHRAEFFPLAARPRAAHLRRRAVPRRAAARPRAAWTLDHRCQRRPGPRPGRTDHRDRAGPPLRAVVLRRGGGVARAVPPWRCCGDARRPRGPPAARAVGATWPRQSAIAPAPRRR